MKTNGNAGRIKRYRENLNFIKSMIEDNGDEVIEVTISYTAEKPQPSKTWKKDERKQKLKEFIKELVEWGQELK